MRLGGMGEVSGEVYPKDGQSAPAHAQLSTPLCDNNLRLITKGTCFPFSKVNPPSYVIALQQIAALNR